MLVAYKDCRTDVHSHTTQMCDTHSLHVQCSSFLQYCTVYLSFNAIIELAWDYTVGFSDTEGTLSHQFVLQYLYKLYFADTIFGVI